MNALFDRLSLQGRLRQLIERYGESQGLEIIQQALQRELKYIDIKQREKQEKCYQK